MPMVLSLTMIVPCLLFSEHERVYLVHEGEGLDLFPLHAFADILQWREERYEFERLEEVAPQIYFRLNKASEATWNASLSAP